MNVVYADEEPNGLAAMVGGLIEANLRQHPERRSLLRPAVLELVAADAGVSVRIALSPGQASRRRSGRLGLAAAPVVGPASVRPARSVLKGRPPGPGQGPAAGDPDLR